MLFLISLDCLLKDAYIIFQKVLIILRYSTKHANLGLEMQFPLKDQIFYLMYSDISSHNL